MRKTDLECLLIGVLVKKQYTIVKICRNTTWQTDIFLWKGFKVRKQLFKLAH